MRKIVILVFMMLFVLTLVSCGEVSKTEVETFEQQETEEKEETIELVEVDSIVLKDNFGNEHVITKESSFYEVLGLMKFSDNNYETIDSRVAKFDVTFKLAEQEKVHLTGELYHFSPTKFFWNLKIEDKNKNVFTFQEFRENSHVDNENITEIVYRRYKYKDEIAMRGYEYIVKDGVSTRADYGGRYPSIPQNDTELGEMYHQATTFVTMFNLFKFFVIPTDFEHNNEIYSLTEDITRNFTLYNEMIVFEQTSPVIGDIYTANPKERIPFYYKAKSGNYKVTQKATFDINTRELKYVVIKGKTISTRFIANADLSLDINVEFEELSEEVYKPIINELMEDIKKNALD